MASGSACRGRQLPVASIRRQRWTHSENHHCSSLCVGATLLRYRLVPQGARECALSPAQLPAFLCRLSLYRNYQLRASGRRGGRRRVRWAGAAPWSGRRLHLDSHLAGWLSDALRPWHIRVYDAPSLARADAAARTLVVADDASLDDDPSDTLRALEPVPVLVLLRKADSRRVTKLLEAGATDAMCPPFLEEELRIRARHLSRLLPAQASPNSVYDRARREVVADDGGRRRLTRSEAILLETLLEAAGAPVSREEPVSRLALRPLSVESNVVDRRQCCCSVPHRRQREGLCIGHGCIACFGPAQLVIRMPHASTPVSSGFRSMRCGRQSISS